MSNHHSSHFTGIGGESPFAKSHPFQTIKEQLVKLGLLDNGKVTPKTVYTPKPIK